ncbi:uncharacterized protein LOC144627425 [Crassostrea virginica]
MPNNSNYCLVLIDWDVYLTIVESSRRIQITSKGPLFVSCRGSLSYDDQLHKVEVLISKQTLKSLNQTETYRTNAIFEERDIRKYSRSRVKTGRYLDIWNDPKSNDRNQTHRDLPDPNEEVNECNLNFIYLLKN